jgi:pimeloyl-ACP methyl ester carboxylesterase
MTAPQPHPVALLLPGMTMNSTLMPDLGVPSLSVDFNEHPPHESAEPEAISIMDYVERLERVLESEPVWRSRPRVVVAHSFGGMLALSWLLRCGDPAPIDGLALVGTSAGPLFDRVRLRVAALAGREWRLPLTRPLSFWNRRWVTRAVAFLLSGIRHNVGTVDFRSLARQSDLALDLAGWRNTDWRAMRAFRMAMSGLDLRAQLPRLQVPTIVLHGSEDSLFPVSVAEELAAVLPLAELRIVRGAGHGLPLTHGNAVVQAVRDLLDRVNPNERS